MDLDPARWPDRRIATTIPVGSFVGRDPELAILRERLTASLAGHGSLALISGDAGIGKTALAEAICREAARRGARVLVGRCYDLSETPPFGPWHEVLADTLSAEVLPPDLTGDVSGSLHATLAGVLNYIVALSNEQPLVLILDDLQWADPASLELLRVLVRKVASMPVFVIATYRPAEVVGGYLLDVLIPTLVRESSPVRIDLSPLDLDAIRTLVLARYALHEEDADRLSGYLAQRSQGNALFLGELMRTLDEEGGIAATAASWRESNPRNARVPVLIWQVITNRLARFEPIVQEALSVAAVIGQKVPIELWQTIVETEDDDLWRMIEQAVAARVLIADDDGVSVTFYHALTREVLYERILPPQRRVLHRRIGEALADQAMPPVDAVAYHFERASDSRAATWLARAGQQALAAYAYLTAADRYEASMRFVAVGSSTQRTRGRLLLRIAWLRFYQDPKHSADLADEASQIANAAGDTDLVAAAVFSRGHFRVTAGDFRRGLADIRTGVDALEGALDGGETWSSLLEMLDAAPLEPFRPDGVLTATLAYCGNLIEARDVGERSLASSMARSRTGYALGDMQLYLGLGIAYAGLGDSERSRLAFSAARASIGGAMQDLLASVIDLYEYTFRVVVFQTDDVPVRRQLIDTVREAWTDVSGAYAVGEIVDFADTLPNFLEGRWDALRAQVRDKLVPPPIRFFQYAVFGDLAYASGETEQVHQLIAEVLPMGQATEPGSGPLVTLLAYQRLASSLALDEQDLSSARSWLEAHDRFLDWSRVVAGRAEGHCGWANYFRSSGDLPRAIRHATRACSLAADPRQPLAMIVAQRTLGEFLTADGQFDRAEQQLNDAISIADFCFVPYERALTLIALAALWHARERPKADVGQPLALLEEARRIFTALGAVPALDRTKHLIKLIEVSGSGNDRFPVGLTGREVEVLRLLASGKSNREIAEQLHVSVHTVHSHVSHIFDKTGCENRAAATAFALRHRLVS